MAGYSGYSKSNSALDAEAEGKFPASVLARELHVKTAAVKAVLAPTEYHHTSKFFNRTDYYAGSLLIPLAAGRTVDEVAAESGEDPDDVRDAADELAAMRAWKPAAPAICPGGSTFGSRGQSCGMCGELRPAGTAGLPHDMR